MDRFEYKHIITTFSARSALRQVEAAEKEGWSLYLLQPTYLFLLGFGGTGRGLVAVMRRPLPQTDGNR